MKRYLVLALAGLAAACATPTPYAPTLGDRYGFSEQQIEQNRWAVTFSGNSLTDRQTVENYLIYRAAELTFQQGFQTFRVVRRATDEDTRLSGTSSSRFHGPYGSPFYDYRYFAPRYGWRPYYDPFWNDVSLREVTRYEATAEIVMMRGPKRFDDPDVFSANDVLQTLGPSVRRVAPNAGGY